ncbi:MAG: hypothetical protein AAF721_16055 [Myxococcota bacterium]
MTTKLTVAAVAFSALAGGCTYGEVTWGNEPVAGATVSISNCDGKSWNTTTNSNGYYGLDGYEDSSLTVTEGLILMMVDINGIQRFDFLFQTWEPCPDDPSQLCDRHDMDFGFKPVGAWEWQVWHAANDQHNQNAIYDFFGFCG